MFIYLRVCVIFINIAVWAEVFDINVIFVGFNGEFSVNSGSGDSPEEFEYSVVMFCVFTENNKFVVMFDGVFVFFMYANFFERVYCSKLNDRRVFNGKFVEPLR